MRGVRYCVANLLRMKNLRLGALILPMQYVGANMLHQRKMPNSAASTLTKIVRKKRPWSSRVRSESLHGEERRSLAISTVDSGARRV